MKNVCFIGAFDKLDLILYISKILTMMDKKILVVDATLMQKSRYIVPVVSPSKSYITTYENIDIAVGFDCYNDIAKYLGKENEKQLKYDYAFIDVDTQVGFNNFYNQETIKNYFVTAFDTYSIRRGLDTIKQINKPIEITKIIFSTEINEQDDYYLEYLALGYKIKWNENKIYFPYCIEDIEAVIENQKLFKIQIKYLSQQYKESLEYIINDMIDNIKLSDIRKTIRNLEKEG